MNDFNYVEVQLRDAIGISDSLIKKTRRAVLEPEADFTLVDGKTTYTKEAVVKLVGFLQGPDTSASNRELADAVDITALLAAAAIAPVPLEKTPIAPPSATSQEPKLLALPWIPPPVEMEFHSKPANPRILLGRIADAAWIKANEKAFEFRTGKKPTRPQRIRVKDNTKFTKGMKIPCRWVQADLWECTRRMPRGQGQW